jgi:hypothetical protein
MNEARFIRYFEQGATIKMIASDYEIFPVDIYEKGNIPANLTGATAIFHLMDYATRENILSKNCAILYDAESGIISDYPFTVNIELLSTDTQNLEGRYTGQLELTDFSGNTKMPFEIEIIIAKKAV